MMRRSALVTGGSRGIGRGIAERLLVDGYRVVINGVRDKSALAATIAELSRLGDVAYVAADVAKAADRDNLIAQTLAAVGRLDVLVNNAGITSPGRNDILNARESDLDTVLGVNLSGPFFLTQAVAKHMIHERTIDESFRGRIVNITSISATVASTNRAEYCMSKAGLSMATMLWAARLAEYDIDVFEVRPGVIETDMTASVLAEYSSRIDAGLTLDRRIGKPADVAGAVAALTSGEISYATGQIMTIDGGLTVARL